MTVFEEPQRFSKRAFPSDLLACSQWCELRGLRPFCDQAVKRVILESIERASYAPLAPEVMRICYEVPFLTADEALQKSQTDLKSMWICLGSSIVTVPWRKEETKAGLRDGQLIGVAGASVFNHGYAGISIFHWWRNKPREKVAHFYGGKQRPV